MQCLRRMIVIRSVRILQEDASIVVSHPKWNIRIKTTGADAGECVDLRQRIRIEGL